MHAFFDSTLFVTYETKFYLPLRVKGPCILLRSVVRRGLKIEGRFSTGAQLVIFYFLNSKGGMTTSD